MVVDILNYLAKSIIPIDYSSHQKKNSFFDLKWRILFSAGEVHIRLLGGKLIKKRFPRYSSSVIRPPMLDTLVFQ